MSMSLSSWFVFTWLLAAGARASRIMSPADGVPVECIDHGVFHECCGEMHRIHPLCVEVDPNEFRCQWEPIQYFDVNVTVREHTLLVQCKPEVDLPLFVQFVLGLLLFCCVSCLRADMYKRHGVVVF